MKSELISDDFIVFTRVKSTNGNGIVIDREFGFLQTPIQFIKFSDYAYNMHLEHETWGDFYASCSEVFFESLSLWYKNGGDYIYESPHKIIGITPEKLYVFDYEDSSGYILKPEYPFKDNNWFDFISGNPEMYNASCMDILSEEESDEFCFIPDPEFTSHLMIDVEKIVALEQCLKKKGKTLLVSPNIFEFYSSF
jgi:hypothetical protein